MADLDYSSYTDDEMKQLLDETLNRSRFPSNADLWAEYDKGEAIKDEWNRRMPKEKQVSPWDINQNIVEQHNLWRQLPAWAKIPGVDLDTNPKIVDLNAVGYVEHDKPNLVNVHTSRSPDPVDTLAHELAHTRQIKYGFPDAKHPFLSDVPTGAVGDSKYHEILQKMRDNEKVMKSSNYADNPLEVFANIEAEMVKGLKKGVPFQDTDLGKMLGASKGSDTLKYIRERTLQGQPTIYEDQVPRTWRDKMQDLLDKYREKLK